MISSLAQSIQRFFGAPTRGSSASLFRLLYGALAVWTAIGVLINFERFYGANALIPWSVVDGASQRFSLLALAPHNDAWGFTVAVAFLLASISLSVGFWSRTSALVVFVTCLALHQRNPYIVNGGDRLFLILGAHATLMPLGARWSWDALRARSQPSTASPVLGQRLAALQVCYVYWATCMAKLDDPTWLDGTALAHVLASPIYAEWPLSVPWLLSALLTWGTLAFELAFPILIWSRRLRPLLIGAGMLFHLGIELSMMIPMFSAIMVVSYVCFLSDEETERLSKLFEAIFMQGKSESKSPS